MRSFNSNAYDTASKIVCSDQFNYGLAKLDERGNAPIDAQSAQELVVLLADEVTKVEQCAIKQERELAAIKLSARQAQMLQAWETFPPEFDILTFATIAEFSETEQKHVRATVRALARKGLTTFVRGCISEDGGVAGAGYGLTDLGRKVMHRNRELRGDV